MTSHTNYEMGSPLDIHPVNVLLVILISLVMIASFAFLVLDGAKEELSAYNDENPEVDEIDSDVVEEIYEEAEKIRAEPDCFGPEATASLTDFNKDTNGWGGEEKSDSEEEHVEEYLPDILLLVRMPYDHACELLRRHNNDAIQFYGWHTENKPRTRSQSI
jgi:hypothetical protein